MTTTIRRHSASLQPSTSLPLHKAKPRRGSRTRSRSIDAHYRHPKPKGLCDSADQNGKETENNPPSREALTKKEESVVRDDISRAAHPPPTFSSQPLLPLRKKAIHTLDGQLTVSLHYSANPNRPASVSTAETKSSRSNSIKNFRAEPEA